MNYTEKQIKDWKAYEKVRASGRFNMIMEGNAAAKSAGLSRDEYIFVIENYSELAAQAEQKQD